MPETEKNYSITQLELCVLAVNVASFANPIKQAYFINRISFILDQHN